MTAIVPSFPAFVFDLPNWLKETHLGRVGLLPPNLSLLSFPVIQTNKGKEADLSKLSKPRSSFLHPSREAGLRQGGILTMSCHSLTGDEGQGRGEQISNRKSQVRLVPQTGPGIASTSGVCVCDSLRMSSPYNINNKSKLHQKNNSLSLPTQPPQ